MQCSDISAPKVPKSPGLHMRRYPVHVACGCTPWHGQANLDLNQSSLVIF